MFRMIARLIQLLLYCTCLIVLLYLSMFYCTHHGLNLHPLSPMYMYMCVFVSCKMLFIYQSFKEIYIIFSLFVPHQFLAVCCSASGIHFPCTPTQPQQFPHHWPQPPPNPLHHSIWNFYHLITCFHPHWWFLKQKKWVSILWMGEKFNIKLTYLKLLRWYLFKVYELMLKEIRHAQKMHYLLNSFNT